MTLGVYAPNIRAGGGLTHLTELLRNASNATDARILVAAGDPVLSRLPSNSQFVHVRLNETNDALGLASLLFPIVAQRTMEACRAVFAPGGICRLRHQRIVAMSQNLLPFTKERLRYAAPAQLRYTLLRQLQSATFRHSAGLVFLTQTARDVVSAVAGPFRPDAEVRVIPHGIDERFRQRPRVAKDQNQYSASNPFRVLYVSIIAPYKHQTRVVDAVGRLREDGLPIALDLVGPAEASEMAELQRTLDRVDPGGDAVRYLGPVPYESLHTVYSAADAFVFASTCENLPNILLEAMASGLPIATSKTQPMPEVVSDGAEFFDAEDPADIANALRRLFENPGLRAQLANRAYERVKDCTWQRCARDTFAFVESIARS